MTGPLSSNVLLSQQDAGKSARIRSEAQARRRARSHVLAVGQGAEVNAAATTVPCTLPE